MENLKIRCRSCGKELEGVSGKTVSCGCPNMATICGDKVSAVDLSSKGNKSLIEIGRASCRERV